MSKIKSLVMIAPDMDTCLLGVKLAHKAQEDIFDKHELEVAKTTYLRQVNKQDYLFQITCKDDGEVLVSVQNKH